MPVHRNADTVFGNCYDQIYKHYIIDTYLTPIFTQTKGSTSQMESQGSLLRLFGVAGGILKLYSDYV